MTNHDPYDPVVVRDRINGLREELGVSMREIADACEMSVSQYADKVYRVKNRFSVEDINLIVKFFRRKTGKKLTCFPFVSYKRATWLDAIREPMGAAWDE